MNKHTTDDYWNCECRHYNPDNKNALSYPDDDCSYIHEKYVVLINKLQKIVEYSKANVLEEPDGAAYIVDMIGACLHETGDV